MSRIRKQAKTPVDAVVSGDAPAVHATEPPSWLMLAMEGRALFEWASWLLAAPWFGQAPRGDGHPVMVLPGLIADDRSTWPLRRFLEKLGYAAYPWEQGRNRGPGNGIEGRLTRRIEQLGARHGAPVSLVGWSLGGLFARALAWRSPEVVRSVITLGSPLNGSADATRARQVFEWASGRNADDPKLRKLMGEHPPVPVTSILSKWDGIVHWKASLAPRRERTESIEVPASHLGMGVNPIVLWAIADRLAQHPERWKPFERSSGWRSLLYRDPGQVPFDDWCQPAEPATAEAKKPR